jgi:hypothetical protein
MILTSSLKTDCFTTVQSFTVKYGLPVELGPLYLWSLMATAWL